MKPTLLIVDDEPAIRFSFKEYLKDAGFNVLEADCLRKAAELLGRSQVQAILLDFCLPDGNGLDWLPELRQTHPDTAVVVVTGVGDVPMAVEAMRRGADNFLTKPVNMEDLEVFLRKSLELGTLRRSFATHQRLDRRKQVFFGNAPAMVEVRNLAAIAATRDVPVLLQGETGTGKGLMARWIYYQSQRRNAPFVEVNCSAIRGELLASELFGHARGAFTGALDAKQGLLDLADGATLFLAEVGDMDLTIQAQFLKVLEEKTYRRLGEVRERHSLFRLLCATNRDLEAEAEVGRFRRDLFFRIHVFPIRMPPLRTRKEDLAALAAHLLADLGEGARKLEPEVLDCLQDYDWPGNVRELRNVLERALLLAGPSPLELGHFPGLRKAGDGRGTNGVQPSPRLKGGHIKEALRRAGGNKKLAAKRLGVSRSTLYRNLQKSDPVEPVED